MSYGGDAFDNADLDEPEDARLIRRPDGSIVAQPHVKRVKTGTWVFYPNNKSRGRSFRTYNRAKRLGGEPDTEYNPKYGGKRKAVPVTREELEAEEPMPQQPEAPQPVQQAPEQGGFGIFSEVMGSRAPQRKAPSAGDQIVRNEIDRFLGFG